MSNAPPLITHDRIEAFTASMLRVVCWLMGAIVRIGGDGGSARLRTWLTCCERAVERLLFLKAAARFGTPQRRTLRPRVTPPGFRRAAPNPRRFYRSARIRAPKASALARVAALIAALARPERAIDHFYKQLCHGLRGPGLVLAAPFAAPVCRRLTATAPTSDTS
ncbi:MAG: hypothetical protein AB7O98_10355 [Hyphomonadaceae bacterium]